MQIARSGGYGETYFHRRPAVGERRVGHREGRPAPRPFVRVGTYLKGSAKAVAMELNISVALIYTYFKFHRDAKGNVSIEVRK